MLEDLEENADAANQAEVVAIKILSELNQTYWLGGTSIIARQALVLRYLVRSLRRSQNRLSVRI